MRVQRQPKVARPEEPVGRARAARPAFELGCPSCGGTVERLGIVEVPGVREPLLMLECRDCAASWSTLPPRD